MSANKPYTDSWYLARAVLPHLCAVSKNTIWPGQQAYVFNTNNRFIKNWPPEYKWINKDEFLVLRLKGEI